jgi:hydrogenase/urease accessory protein HupE
VTARLAVAAALLLPATALAHSPIKGLDGFYAGLLHPVFVPAHLLSVLVFGILVGQQGVRRLQGALIVFLLATALGLVLAGAALGLPTELPLLSLAALLGVLVAIGRPLPAWMCHALAAALGLMLGADSAQDGMSGGQRVGALLGTGIAVYLLALYALAFADWFSRRDWQRVGLRVLGSWAAASALLVLSLRIAG